MSSLQYSTMPSKSDLKFDERRWVSQIRRTLEEELEDDSEVPVSIFNVPKGLLATDPDSYTPQQVALGPYHQWRPELLEMDRYKLAAAKRTHKQLESIQFQNLVDHLTQLEQRIRACYHKYLDFSGETLALMMAVDASFLLEFLQIYAMKEGRVLSRVSSRMSSHLVDYAGTKSAHNAILRDMVMLENQIPLLVLRKMLEFQFSSLKSADDMLLSMLTGLCKELSPFMLMEDLPKIQVSKCDHLLDFFYNMIVPKLQGPPEVIEVEEEDHINEGMQGEQEKSSAGYVKQFLVEIWKLLSKLNRGPINRFIKKVLSRPLKVLLKLPLTILSSIPVFAVLKQPVALILNQDKESSVKKLGNDNNSKPPLIEEITIPSVSDLSKSGVHFSPTSDGSISTIAFDAKTVTFSLPIVSLDVNTEVILRNLVAYEASNASGPLVFTRYTELMNAIIDSEEDVELLRESGILYNHLKSDEEVANLWNGMSKSIKLTKVPFLDKVIEDVNKYHNSLWKVKVGNFMKVYVFGSWQFLTFLAAIMLLLLMTLQAVCSVYRCKIDLGNNGGP